MKVLFWGSTIFCLAFFLHLIVWKIHLPKRQTKALLEIFFGTLIISILTLWNSASFGIFVVESFLEYFHICLFFISFTLAYIITYSGIEADSPSLVIIRKVAEAGSEGLDQKEFDRMMRDDLLIKPRIKDLLSDKMVYMEGDKYKLRSKGALMARIFIFYRQLLNAPKGG
ncbi:MAG: hypothetical protein AB1422_05935 [bacterium]